VVIDSKLEENRLQVTLIMFLTRVNVDCIHVASNSIPDTGISLDVITFSRNVE
jgi:hypothetical protein